MAGKTAGIKFLGHSYESCKSPRQMERENEMIVISHRFFCGVRHETRRHETFVVSGIVIKSAAMWRIFR